MANTNIQNPKLTISTIKSPLTDGGFSLGNVGQEGNSKTGTLARIVGKNRISINSLIKSQETQDRKITILKNIVQNIQKNVVKNIQNIQKDVVQNVQKNIVEDNQKNIVQNNIAQNTQKNIVGDKIKINAIEKTQKIQDRKITILKNISRNRQSNIGQKLPDSGESNIEKSLMETNQILVQIQQELMRSSALRSKEEKSKLDREKRGASRAKLSAEESQLEKSSRRIKDSVGEKAEGTLAPVKGIFERIMDFLSAMVIGIAGNAIFEWLKDPENMEKVKGWFSWIKDNWKWAAAAVGAIALLPVVSTIAGILKPIGTIIGLLMKALPLLKGLIFNPLFLKAMLAIGAGVLIFKGGQILVNEIRKIFTGSQGFSDAHDQLDKKLRDAGLDNKGRTSKARSGRNRGQRPELTQEQIEVRDSVMKKREQLKELSKNMTEEIKSERSKIMGNQMGRSASSRKADTLKESKLKITQEYEARIPSIMGNIEARAKGGPVIAGKPYIVGEKGPELFMPNIGGTVVNNQKTERIYQMISSRRKGRGGVNIVNLPPITNKMPPPELPPMGGQATDVPSISSVNMADPYRQLSPMLYGITV